MFKLLRKQILGVALTYAVLPFGAQADVITDVDGRRELAVLSARAGQLEVALADLARLHEEYPVNQRIRNDYAVVAAWAGKDALTTQLLTEVELTSLPDYVLAPYAKALRNEQFWMRSIETYREWQSRAPLSFDAKLGLVLTHADAGNYEASKETLATLHTLELTREEVATSYFACGYIAERERQFVAALDCYNLGLRITPDDTALLERRAIIAAALGANEFANAEYANLHADPKSELANSLQLDATALRLRWAGLEENKFRYEAASEALLGHDRILHPNKRQEQTRDFDRIVGLVAGYQMQEALDVYNTLGLQPDELPAYVLAALAQAHLYFNNTDRSIQYFRYAIAKVPPEQQALEFDLQVGLFHALSDNGHYEEAGQLASKLANSQYPWIRPTNKIWLENERYTVAREVGALALAYREEYDRALSSFDDLLSVGAANEGLRLSNATLQRWRGWYRASELETAKVSDPGFELPRTTLSSHIYLDRGAYRRAELGLTKAKALHPRDKGVQALDRRWRLHNRPQVQISAQAGQSDGTELGSESYSVDAHYYTSPFAYNYRAFVHAHTRWAEFLEGDGRDTRVGVGLEYRGLAWSLSGEVHTGLEQNSSPGLTLNHQWDSTDHWRHSTTFNYNGLNIPLRGTRVGIEGEDISHTTTYRWHESAEASVGFGYMRIDDGNERLSASARYQRRIFNAPRHKTAFIASLFTSESDDLVTPYFNPESDLDTRIGLLHEWRIQQTYELVRKLRVGASIGRYYQEGFGSDSLWTTNVEYEQELDHLWSITVGTSIGRRPYDGIQERQEQYYLTFRSKL